MSTFCVSTTTVGSNIMQVDPPLSAANPVIDGNGNSYYAIPCETASTTVTGNIDVSIPFIEPFAIIGLWLLIAFLTAIFIRKFFA